MSDVEGITGRKAQHLEICLDNSRYQVESSRSRLGEVALIHRALPEIDAATVDTSFEFLGYRCRLPLFISSMTGGSGEGYRTNKELATVAAELGVAVGMGSIRILLRKPEVIGDFRLKEFAPTVPVFANIGGVQLPRVPHEDLFRLLEELRVDGIAVHLNPGQELFQPEGDRDFRGVLEALRKFIARSPVPVIVKETGFGINPAEVEVLQNAGATWVDIAGAGGTNWVRVEAYREGDASAPIADCPPGATAFDQWGLPTALILAALGRKRRGILASGGIRTGMDVVRCLALGAEATGIALPFVRALRSGGIEDALRYGRELEQVIRIATTLSGCTATGELRHAPLRVSRELREDAEVLRDALAGAAGKADG